MLIRPLLVGVAASAVLLVGCSKGPTVTHVTPKPEASSSASSASTSASETAEAAESASGPLGPDECVEVTGARLDIILAGNAEEATPPADTLKKYGPPPTVVEAIDHFVETAASSSTTPRPISTPTDSRSGCRNSARAEPRHVSRTARSSPGERAVRIMRRWNC